MAQSSPPESSSLHTGLCPEEERAVHAELARTLARLVRLGSASTRAVLQQEVVVLLDLIAQDQVMRVRALIEAERGEDCSRLTCRSVMEYAPLLNDADLKELINACSMRWALQQFAGRRRINREESDALIDARDGLAVATLFTHANPQMRENALDSLLSGDNGGMIQSDMAVVRASLSVRTVRRIAHFVAAAMIERLIDVQEIDLDAAQSLLQRVHTRIDATPLFYEDEESLCQRARQVVASGRFNDAWVLEQLAIPDTPLVVAALACAAEISLDEARRIITSRDGRVIMALAWKAGLLAATALALQDGIGHVPPEDRVVPRGQRFYPLPARQMEWVLAAYAESAS